MTHIKRESKIWYTPKKKETAKSLMTISDPLRSKKRKKKKEEEESTVAEMCLGTKLSLKFHCKFHP